MVTKGKKIIFSILFILLVVWQPLITVAAEESKLIKNEVINPGSFYFSFKRLWEKGTERLQFSIQSKISFHEALLKRRLAELNYVAENKLLSEVQTSSERFAYEAGILTQDLVKQSKVNEKQALIKQFGQYGEFLPKLRDKFEANSSYWMLIQHDINTLKILTEKLK